jgi:hypothetical protein
MASTVVIKGLCWLWCRMVKNSSVQALYVELSLSSSGCHLLTAIQGFRCRDRRYFQRWLYCIPYQYVAANAVYTFTATDYDVLTLYPVGFYARIWWLDALGGLLLSMVVIYNWSRTSIEHIKHLSGFSATADQRNICKFHMSYPQLCSCTV